jgi:hypothetical protein
VENEQHAEKLSQPGACSQVLASSVMALAWNIYMSSMSHKAVEPAL